MNSGILDEKTADQLRRTNEQLREDIERMRSAIMIAAEALRTDMDIPDVEALTQCTEGIKQRRIALRFCEAALR